MCCSCGVKSDKPGQGWAKYTVINKGKESERREPIEDLCDICPLGVVHGQFDFASKSGLESAVRSNPSVGARVHAAGLAAKDKGLGKQTFQMQSAEEVTSTTAELVQWGKLIDKDQFSTQFGFDPETKDIKESSIEGRYGTKAGYCVEDVEAGCQIRFSTTFQVSGTATIVPPERQVRENQGMDVFKRGAFKVVGTEGMQVTPYSAADLDIIKREVLAEQDRAMQDFAAASAQAPDGSAMTDEEPQPMEVETMEVMLADENEEEAAAPPSKGSGGRGRKGKGRGDTSAGRARGEGDSGGRGQRRRLSDASSACGSAAATPATPSPASKMARSSYSEKVPRPGGGGGQLPKGQTYINKVADIHSILDGSYTPNMDLYQLRRLMNSLTGEDGRVSDPGLFQQMKSASELAAHAKEMAPTRLMLLDDATLKVSLKALKSRGVILQLVTKKGLWHRQVVAAVKDLNFQKLSQLFLGSPSGSSDEDRVECLSYVIVDLVLLPVVVAGSMQGYTQKVLQCCKVVLDILTNNQELVQIKTCCRGVAAILDPLPGACGSEPADVEFVWAEEEEGGHHDDPSEHQKRMTLLRKAITGEATIKALYAQWEASLLLPDQTGEVANLRTAVDALKGDTADANKFRDVFKLMPKLQMNLRDGALQDIETEVMSCVAERVKEIQGIDQMEGDRLARCLAEFYPDANACMIGCKPGAFKTSLKKELGVLAPLQAASQSLQMVVALDNACKSIEEGPGGGVILADSVDEQGRINDDWAKLFEARKACHGQKIPPLAGDDDQRNISIRAFYRRIWDIIQSQPFSEWHGLDACRINLVKDIGDMLPQEERANGSDIAFQMAIRIVEIHSIMVFLGMCEPDAKSQEVDKLTRTLALAPIKAPAEDDAETIRMLRSLTDGLRQVKQDANDLRVRLICEFLAAAATDIETIQAKLTKNAYGGKNGHSWKQPLNANSPIAEVREAGDKHLLKLNGQDMIDDWKKGLEVVRAAQKLVAKYMDVDGVKESRALKGTDEAIKQCFVVVRVAGVTITEAQLLNCEGDPSKEDAKKWVKLLASCGADPSSMHPVLYAMLQKVLQAQA
ncbi:unnamed protein product [Prorocentrum cordatum]|uniref:Uncharacterized protein n=1 Tax=Prorocentrum cordatum TaxID=2364126 RepID=A0ABN9YA29_9DINO|nr:unnamed protein product [Polarella glacialis]